MIVRTTEEITGTDRDVSNEDNTWRSKRIVLADDLEPYERLKLHILNLGHTFLAEIWQREGRPEGETVREILADPGVRARLDALYGGICS